MIKSSMHYWANQKLSVFVMVAAFMVAMVMPVQHVLAQSTYYVGGTGASDSNPGTSSQPWATIQKAATVAVSGDIVNIRTGTYRETITPTNSGTSGNPITYRPDGGATVVVSGLNTADGGWTVHSGSIYKKTITLPVSGYNATISSNTTLGANQVFKGGVMQFEARWPKLNNTADLLDRSKVFRNRTQTSDWTSTTLTDASLPNISGGWVGGKIFMNGWFISQTKNITSHSGTTIGYQEASSDLRFLQFYYVTGRLGALTQAKEWHYEGGILYFWQEAGGSPTGVEYKARNWGFNLIGKSNITIEGLNFIGCEPMTGDVNSNNIILDGIKAQHTNHTVVQEEPDVIYRNPLQTGIKLIGSNCIIRNSEIQWTASSGIWLGTNGRAENNLITDINYEANYGAGVAYWGTTGGQVTTGNTIARCGRSAIDYGGNITFGQHLNMDISYNDIYHTLMLHADGGSLYGARMVNLTGTRIHHNWIHDNLGQDTPYAPHEVGIETGLYFDQVCGPTTIDHNVMWNNAETDIVNQQWDPQRPDAGTTRIINNTLVSDYGDTHPLTHSYLTSVTSPSDYQRNNIYRDDCSINFVPAGPGVGDVANSLFEDVNPLFIGTGSGGLVYRLSSGSPAINAGMVITGITDGSVDAPDIGAYEFGATDWVPGYVAPAGGTVATPTFNPVAGTYTAAQSVTISTSTSGASIRYTTDGSTPTASSTLYSSPVSISSTTTLKAIGIKSGMTNSAVATAVYTINISGSTTVNNTVTGTGQNQFEYVGAGWGSGASTGAYLNDEHYNLTTNSYYNVDFTGTQIAVYSQKFNSQGISAYSIDGGAETLVDQYNSTLLLNTLVYTSPVLANTTHTLKARVTGTKNASSSNFWLVADRVVITSGAATVETPTFNPIAGTYTSTQSVTISTLTSGAEIRYTTDGSTPTASSTLYTAPVSVAATTTLKAIGIKSGMTNSAIGTAVYTISTGGANIAQGKTATQSSTYQTSYASIAVDGSTNGNGAANIQHTLENAQAWWQVDLGANYNIGDIKVWNRTDSEMGRLSDYYVRVLNSSQVEVWSNHQTSYPNPSTTVNAGGVTGRYVKVQLTGTGFLHMAEVQVYESGGGTVATPTFSPVAGTYTSAQSVTISTTTSGATIRYTTDGSTPTGSSTLYSAPVSVAATTTLKAIGIKTGLTNSAVGTAVYTIQVATPTFSPVAGTYTSTQSVTISTTTSGDEIRYTTDGSTPTGSSTLYSTPVSVSVTTTLKAIGIKSGLTTSAVGTAAYTINISGATEVNDTVVGTGQNQFEYVGTGWSAGPSTGAYLDDEHYTQTTNDYYNVDFTGTQIAVYSQKFTSSGIAAYSIDGGAETNVDQYNSTLLLNTLVYTSPVLADASHTLKVRVTGTKNASSSATWLVADRVVITAGTQVETPTFSPVAGTYTSAQSVTISTTTSGAEIRYTTDGSTPTGSSTLYSTPVSVSISKTLKAIAIKSGMTDSAIGTAVYTITGSTTVNDMVTGTGQNQFEFVGAGWSSGASTGAYLNDEHYSLTTDNYYNVDFTGTQIQVYSQKFTSSGIAAYSIDGGAETFVDQYNSTLLLNTLVYTSPTLSDTSHTLKVRVTGTKNASSSSYWVVADRVVITSNLKSTKINTSSGGVTGIDYSQNSQEYIIYPNPGDGRFSLKGNFNLKSAEIYNVTGEKIYTLHSINQDGIEEINISEFPNGIYLIRLFDGEKYFSKKLIIRKD